MDGRRITIHRPITSKTPSKARTWGKRVAIGAAVAGFLGTVAFSAKPIVNLAKRGTLQRGRPAVMQIQTQRATVARIYGLNEQRAADKNVLDLISKASKKNGVSLKGILETLERNAIDKQRIKDLQIRIGFEKNPAEKERLQRIQNVLQEFIDNPVALQRIEEIRKKPGTLDRIRTSLPD